MQMKHELLLELFMNSNDMKYGKYVLILKVELILFEMVKQVPHKVQTSNSDLILVFY